MMQDSSSDSDDSREIKGSVDFGSALASARKLKNYTVEQISEQLKIPARTILALEENNISVLPAPTFTQGYIRAYAKYLEISVEDVLANYNRAVPHDEASDLKPRSNLPEEASSQSPIVKTVTMLLIFSGILAIIYGSFQYYQEKADVMETAFESKHRSFTGGSLDSPSTDRIIIKQNARMTDEGELIVLSPGTVDDNVPVSAAEVEAEESSEKSLAATLAKSEQTAKQEETREQEAISVDVLTISAEKGSWVQVRDATTARLLYNMVPVGGVEVLQGQAPFRVSLGNAKTTHVTINDLEVDISEYIRDNNTAKFSVSSNRQQVVFH
ncbi:hypothetical protein MNBD_GAMMA05-771 [hydrothermal vent metagenome]|uniref:HTH cro/C1-type domain-containing protein n=1 Tax=hydrothermal vent metagenome TaxID=652676 RepID=A0A3B0WE46_9ZZZZ